MRFRRGLSPGTPTRAEHWGPSVAPDPSPKQLVPILLHYSGYAPGAKSLTNFITLCRTHISGDRHCTSGLDEGYSNNTSELDEGYSNNTSGLDEGYSNNTYQDLMKDILIIHQDLMKVILIIITTTTAP
jgi:hypothetical protein